MPDASNTVSRETGELVSRETAEPVDRYRGEDYETLQTQADTVFGAELEEGNQVLGVPFIIVMLTYRPGDNLNAITNTYPDYVSIDLIVGTEKEIAKGIRRGRIKEPCELEPGEHLVINEGGTGVYRQTVEYLEHKGWITLPDGPKNGAYGESRFDTPVEKWEYPDGSPVEMRFTSEGKATASVDVRLECPRGLRISEYDNAYAKGAATRYIA